MFYTKINDKLILDIDGKVVIIVIDKNKKLMLIIVDPMGECDVNYFKDEDSYHFKILREYINNKSIGISLKFDLNRADQEKQQLEDNLYELTKIFNKNGYMLFYDTTDYRQYREDKKHSGHIALPTDIEHLSEVHKQVLQQISNEIIVDNVCTYKKTDKIVFHKLPIFYYDKYEKEMKETGQSLDEILMNSNQVSKHLK